MPQAMVLYSVTAPRHFTGPRGMCDDPFADAEKSGGHLIAVENIQYSRSNIRLGTIFNRNCNFSTSGGLRRWSCPIRCEATANLYRSAHAFRTY